MYLLGPANAGKTWFLNCIGSLYLNVGYVHNPVRGEHFPYNDCVNRRVLIWNEPCVMTSALEDVKMLAGGDPLPVNVKYESNSTINRTPLFFTANTLVLPMDKPEFKSRVFLEQWNSAPFLATYNKYPHPLGIYEIFRKYNIHIEE